MKGGNPLSHFPPKSPAANLRFAAICFCALGSTPPFDQAEQRRSPPARSAPDRGAPVSARHRPPEADETRNPPTLTTRTNRGRQDPCHASEASDSNQEEQRRRPIPRGGLAGAPGRPPGKRHLERRASARHPGPPGVRSPLHSAERSEASLSHGAIPAGDGAAVRGQGVMPGGSPALRVASVLAGASPQGRRIAQRAKRQIAANFVPCRRLWPRPEIARP